HVRDESDRRLIHHGRGYTVGRKYVKFRLRRSTATSDVSPHDFRSVPSDSIVPHDGRSSTAVTESSPSRWRLCRKFQSGRLEHEIDRDNRRPEIRSGDGTRLRRDDRRLTRQQPWTSC